MNSGLLHLPDTGIKKLRSVRSPITKASSLPRLHVCTLICSSRAVRREMRWVRLGFVALCCPSFETLLIWTICWASSSQRLRSSVGWSAGTIPWSGASCLARAQSQILHQALSGHPHPPSIPQQGVGPSDTPQKGVRYLAAVLLDFVKHFVEVFIQLFKLQHCGCILPLEI